VTSGFAVEARHLINVVQAVVAVVDDHPGIRDALKNLLMTHGCVVELYASAADFLDKTCTTKAACLVTDIQLGDLSGIEMCRRLRDAGFLLPIVFMTASQSRFVRARAMELGCIAYLVKPFRAKLFMDAIRRAIQKS
jgi:FixJ family two-component response regulator